MKSIAIVLLVLFLLKRDVYARDRVYIFKEQENGFTKIMSLSKTVFFITATAIYQVNNKELNLKIQLIAKCNDAAVYKEGFALATDSGIFYYSIQDNALKRILPEQIANRINHVVTDGLNRLWYTSNYDGAYMIDDNNNILSIVKAPVVYSIASTPDSTIWVGTNIGLYKIPLNSAKIFRYSEEGIEGFELPDNLVEQIYADKNSNLWALLPDKMVFIQHNKNEKEEIPSYRYIGSNANKVFCIHQLSVSDKTYLFATKEGIMYNKDLKGLKSINSGEIHQSYYETVYLIQDILIEKPFQLQDQMVINIATVGDYTWLTTIKGIWKINTRKLKKNLQRFKKK